MRAADCDGRLRIGVIAPELFDRPGGMPEYARQLAAALADTDDVVVYVPRGERFGDEAWRCEAVLERDLRTDLERLARERVDVWFACNAALVALSPSLQAPLVTYLNGNDVLNPWLTFERAWHQRLEQTPLLWRLTPALRRNAVRRDVRRGLQHASLVANSRSTARLTVARLESWSARKNVDGVLNALRLLPADLRVHYTVVGDGDDRRRLEELADELELQDRVSFVGAVPRDELLACYRDTDLFIMASRARTNDVEGFGIVYLEAAAAGVPSLCSRAGGATDAVRDGESGILLDGAEPTDIANGILRFVRERNRFDPGRVRSFAEQFRWPQVGRRVRETLADVHAA